MTAFYIRRAAPSSSSPLFRRNLVWSYRLMSCRDTLPLFFDNDRTDSGNDRERMVGCHSSRRRAEPRSVKDRNLGAPTRHRKRERCGCPSRPEKEHADCLYSRHTECLSSPRRNGLRSGCPSRHLKQSMRTASAPDKWNVSHRPVVYGHQFMSCRVLELSIKSYVRSSLGRRNLSHVAIHVSCDSLSVFGSVGCWKALRLGLRNCYAITIFTGGFCLEDGEV